MNQYVYDMKVSPIKMNTPPFYEYTIPIMLTYIKISDVYKGGRDELILKKYFSQETVNSFNERLPVNKAQIEKQKVIIETIADIKDFADHF